MKNLKSHFKFNKQERSGIFFLLFFIVLLQCVYFFYKDRAIEGTKDSITVDAVLQTEIDELKKREKEKKTLKVYPFNPNYISDYKGYTLGMSITEIDRLHAYRALDKYVNTAVAFQEVTKVSDSLLNRISPFFKFPEWVQKKKEVKTTLFKKKTNKTYVVKRNLNKATASDLMTINGIGEKLSARIIKFRNRLGGFLVDEQLYDVYGLESIVVKRVLLKYEVLTPPKITKININTASISEIAELVYIPYSLAQRIVVYRENISIIKTFKELEDIEGFPKDKIDRIQLYLSLR